MLSFFLKSRCFFDASTLAEGVFADAIKKKKEHSVEKEIDEDLPEEVQEIKTEINYHLTDFVQIMTEIDSFESKIDEISNLLKLQELRKKRIEIARELMMLDEEHAVLLFLTMLDD